jgi:hypothetical protein
MAGTILDFLNSFGMYGIVILAILWFIKEKIYYIPDISGQWEMILTYKKTDFILYENMEVKYKMFINQNNEYITINGEKYFEKLNNNNTKEYQGNEKTFSEYDGYIKRAFFNHSLILNIKEIGQERIVAGQLKLKIVSPNSLLKGTFDRQDANSKGMAVLSKIND